jgi:site-specific recombinase XerD
MERMDAEECLKQFTLDNQIRLNPESLKNYQCAVKQFLGHTEKSLEAITKSDIRTWFGYLKEKGYKPWTIWSKLTGLKTFFHYCWEEGIIPTNPAKEVPFPHVGEQLPRYLTLEQLNRLRQLLNGRLEERAIIEVLYTTGVRISELCAMKREDIDWSERTIHVPKGKRKRGRIVLFTRECAEHLKIYLDSRTDDSPYVFLSVTLKDRSIHPDTVGQWFTKYYTKRLGFKVTPHTLRHTFAAHLAQKGMPIECIQSLLGHEDPHQTRLYARLFNHARKEMYDEFL